MKLKALSHYDNDMDTRFGDCILLYGETSLVVYDCGHSRHAQEVEAFLESIVRSRLSMSWYHIMILTTPTVCASC